MLAIPNTKASGKEVRIRQVFIIISYTCMFLYNIYTWPGVWPHLLDVVHGFHPGDLYCHHVYQYEARPELLISKN